MEIAFWKVNNVVRHCLVFNRVSKTFPHGSTRKQQPTFVLCSLVVYMLRSAVKKEKEKKKRNTSFKKIYGKLLSVIVVALVFFAVFFGFYCCY